MNQKESQQHLHSSFNRGIYLVRYTGNGQEDKPNNPGLLVIPNGACKFGQSLNLDTVEKRYISHFKKEENVIEKLRSKIKDVRRQINDQEFINILENL